MAQALTRINDSDFGGIEKVLAAYGGMGSFNDIHLTKITNSNEQFSILQSRAWELATAIKQKHEIAT